MSFDFIRTSYSTLANACDIKYVPWKPTPNEPQTYTEACLELAKAVGSIAIQLLTHPRILLCCGLAMTERSLSQVNAVQLECDQTGLCQPQVKVAVIDSSFDLQHPLYRKNFYRFKALDPKYPCGDKEQKDAVGCAFYPGVSFPLSLNNTYNTRSINSNIELRYHGTKTSSAIVLETPSQVSILPIICSDIEEFPLAIKFAKNQGADLISISLSFGIAPSSHKNGVDFFSDEDKAVAYKKKNLVAEEIKSFPGPIFISAGNDHQKIDHPELLNWGRRILLANIPKVYYVAAAEKVDNQWKISRYSNFGKAIDFASPVPDTVFLPCERENDPCYGSISPSTSYSVPKVAATYALMLLEDPSLTIKKAMMIFKQTGDSLSDRKDKQVPYVVNRYKALEKVKKDLLKKPKILNG
jgi:hypothetical protein